MMKKLIMIVFLFCSLFVYAGGGKKHKTCCWDSSEAGCAYSRKEEIRMARLEKERRHSESSSSAATIVTPRVIELVVKKLRSEDSRRASK